jgi:hypothetical protein
MDLNDQLRRYFGTADLSEITASTLEAGLERARVDLGLEKDRPRRFALWTLLYMLNAAPDLDVVFSDRADIEAARDFMDMVDKAGSAEQE